MEFDGLAAGPFIGNRGNSQVTHALGQQRNDPTGGGGDSAVDHAVLRALPF